MRRQLWGLQSRGLRGELGLDDGCDLSSMNHVWIINHSLDSNQVFNSCGVNYLPALFVFWFFSSWFRLQSCQQMKRGQDVRAMLRLARERSRPSREPMWKVRLCFNPLESHKPWLSGAGSASLWMGENFSEWSWSSYVMQPTSVLTQSDPNLCTLNLGNLSQQKTDYAVSHDELRITCRSAPPHECCFLFQDWAGPITGFQTLREVIEDIYLLLNAAIDCCLMRPLLFMIRLHFPSLYISSWVAANSVWCPWGCPCALNGTSSGSGFECWS